MPDPSLTPAENIPEGGLVLGVGVVGGGVGARGGGVVGVGVGARGGGWWGGGVVLGVGG